MDTRNSTNEYKNSLDGVELIYPFINHQAKIVSSLAYEKVKQAIKNIESFYGENFKDEKELMKCLYKHGYRYVKATSPNVEKEINKKYEKLSELLQEEQKIKQEIIELKNSDKDYGIYEIVDKRTGEVLYVGMTMTSFEDRWEWHRDSIEHPENSQNQSLYGHLAAAGKENIEYKKIVTNKMVREEWYLPYAGQLEFSESLFRLVEYSVVKAEQPRFNRAGIGEVMYK